MSRLTILLIMAVWLLGAEAFDRNPTPAHGSMSLFFGGYVLVVAAVAIWSRWLARRVTADNFRRLFRRFNHAIGIVRWFVPAWMVVDILRGGVWTQLVLSKLGGRLELPAMVVGIAPAILTWIALWWAEYPAERAMREQNVLDEVMNGMPVHAPPTLSQTLILSARLQLLPMLLPILLIELLRDLVHLSHLTTSWNDLMMIPAALIVYLLSPFLLIWLFNARPLEDSPLRQRLEAICKRCGLKYRNIMLWQTDFSMANAAVIGLLPGWRYVLLSDRLLETMSDREIEAVFAHELGHIVHNHMAWLVVFFAILILMVLGPGQLLEKWLDPRLPQWVKVNFVVGLTWGGICLAATLVLLGYVSRRFERQADVFAARMMEVNWGWPTVQSEDAPRFGVAQSYVGQRGSAMFAAALNRVAYVNNIPIRARGFFHPSIEWRLRYLEEMSIDPTKTSRFDQVMGHLYAVMILVLMTCGTVAAAVLTAI
jgi:STE24 endopeptidase